MSLPIARVVDASGLVCPEPVMLLHSAVRDAQPGEVIKVVATDPSTVRDIRQFCEFLGHPLAEHYIDGQQFIFLVQKGA